MYIYCTIGISEKLKNKLKLNQCKTHPREREMFYLTTHSTHFIYGYMASDIWLRTILIVRKVTRCRHIGYSYWLTARVLLYAPSHRQDNTYHSLCYTSRGALAGKRNSSMGLPQEGSIRQPTAPWANTLPLSYMTLPKAKRNFTTVQLEFQKKLKNKVKLNQCKTHPNATIMYTENDTHPQHFFLSFFRGVGGYTKKCKACGSWTTVTAHVTRIYINGSDSMSYIHSDKKSTKEWLDNVSGYGMGKAIPLLQEPSVVPVLVYPIWSSVGVPNLIQCWCTELVPVLVYPTWSSVGIPNLIQCWCTQLDPVLVYPTWSSVGVPNLIQCWCTQLDPVLVYPTWSSVGVPNLIQCWCTQLDPVLQADRADRADRADIRQAKNRQIQSFFWPSLYVI